MNYDTDIYILTHTCDARSPHNISCTHVSSPPASSRYGFNI